MTFERAGYVLAPVGGTVVDVAPAWARPANLDATTVWGALPRPPGPARALLEWAARRERALARAGHAVRLPANVLRDGGLRTDAASWLRAGAVVEPRPPVTRRIDLAARAAGADVSRYTVATGGGVVVMAGDRVLRAGRQGTPADPSPERDALAALAGSAVPAPRLLGHGEVEGVSWCAEQRLPGVRPPVLDDALAAQVLGALARFPDGAAPAGAFRRDVDAACTALPSHSSALRELESQAAAVLSSMPAVARHGDLWVGNLLVERGHLTAILDWDAFDRDGTPGADLLQLVAAELRLDAHASLGTTFLRRPQHLPRFTALAASYWRARDLPEPTSDQLDAIAVAWWVTQLASTVQRTPALRDDDQWVEENVGRVLSSPAG